jgi:GGDEF domain-containing protein
MFSLVYCNVADFKAINDEYSPMKNNEDLRSVGTFVKGAIRKMDIPGADFCVVLPDSSIGVGRHCMRKDNSVSHWAVRR